jgi:hypothetical protein
VASLQVVSHWFESGIAHSNKHAMTETDREEVKAMIDEAIAHHNKTATLISACLGSVLLGFYAHGVLALVNR